MMYVVNLALRRPDGKIETDTFFTEKKPTQETANEIAEKHNCSAIVAICGTFKEYSEAMQEKNIWICEKELKEAVDTDYCKIQEDYINDYRAFTRNFREKEKEDNNNVLS